MALITVLLLTLFKTSSQPGTELSCETKIPARWERKSKGREQPKFVNLIISAKLHVCTHAFPLFIKSWCSALPTQFAIHCSRFIICCVVRGPTKVSECFLNISDVPGLLAQWTRQQKSAQPCTSSECEEPRAAHAEALLIPNPTPHSPPRVPNTLH